MYSRRRRYHIRSPYDSAGVCFFESYDEETGTAFFLVTVKQMNGKPFPSDKITFSVSEFLSGKQEYNGVLSDIELFGCERVSRYPDRC